MPVLTRRQAQAAQEVHALSHTNLNNLPAEIIGEIASHLRSDWHDCDSEDSDFSDDDYDQMSVGSVDPEDEPPEVKVLPCCRQGESQVAVDGSRIPVLDHESIFSATSKRIREIVFNRRQSRRRTIRYCDQWRRETMSLSVAARHRYT